MKPLLIPAGLAVLVAACATQGNKAFVEKDVAFVESKDVKYFPRSGKVKHTAGPKLILFHDMLEGRMVVLGEPFSIVHNREFDYLQP